jgi:hypothetical protein
MQEHDFIEAFGRAGFHGIELASLQAEPWQTVEGIEFRSATVIAYKAPPVAAGIHRNAVMYRGPFAEVRDDRGNLFRRGERTAVGPGTFETMRRLPYADHFVSVEPAPSATAEPAKSGEPSRDATPGPASDGNAKSARLTILGGGCCGADDRC